MLKVIAVPGHLVLDDVRAQNRSRRWVGRAQAPVAGGESLEEFYPPQACEYPDNAAHSYILRNIRKGGLKPLDEYTARRGGVPFRKPAERASAPQKGA